MVFKMADEILQTEKQKKQELFYARTKQLPLELQKHHKPWSDYVTCVHVPGYRPIFVEWHIEEAFGPRTLLIRDRSINQFTDAHPYKGGLFVVTLSCWAEALAEAKTFWARFFKGG